MTETEEFKDWAVKLARAAMKYQDMTFRQMVEKKIIPSWAEHVLKSRR